MIFYVNFGLQPRIIKEFEGFVGKVNYNLPQKIRGDMVSSRIVLYCFNNIGLTFFGFKFCEIIFACADIFYFEI